MTTALIVLGVIAFLAIDGYVLYRVLRSRRTADDVAVIAVPGEAAVMLSPGKIKLTYQESYTASGDAEGDIDFGVPGALSVSVLSPAGEELEVKGPGFGGLGVSLSTGRGWSRAVVGTVEIGEHGEHRVTAGGELEGAVEPRILVGT
jgi:hypothetical protein